MTPIAVFLARVEGARRSGGGWQARCPAHDDRHPSLSITEADGTGGAPDGAVLVRCHAGCPTERVLAAVGLAMPDLFPETGRAGIRWLRSFVYAEESGEVIYRIRRGEFPRSGTRRWIVEHPSGTVWAKEYADDRRLLYRLPELAANPDLPVWATEGERDADSLARGGLLTTTVPHGAWEKTDLRPLSGRPVVLVVDNDTAGWTRGRKAQEALVSAGARLIATRRPLDGYKDVTDHLAAGLTTDLLPVVDLYGERPPPPAPPPPRSAYADDGRALRVSAPYGVLLHGVQSGALTHLDVSVWMLMEGRAGVSGLARLTIRDIAYLVGPAARATDPHPLKEHTVSKSMERLTKAQLIEKTDRRGEWRVANPSFLDRRAKVPKEISFRDRRNPTSNTTSSSTTPQYEPRETPPRGGSISPEGRFDLRRTLPQAAARTPMLQNTVASKGCTRRSQAPPRRSTDDRHRRATGCAAPGNQRLAHRRHGRRRRSDLRAGRGRHRPHGRGRRRDRPQRPPVRAAVRTGRAARTHRGPHRRGDLRLGDRRLADGRRRPRRLLDHPPPPEGDPPTNDQSRAALAAAADAFRAADLRLREADLVRRVAGEVVPTACFACGRPEATYGPPRRSAGYRACGECFALERTAGSETLFRHALTEAVLAAHGYIGPDEMPPVMTEAPVYADTIGASPRRPLADRWGYFTMSSISDLAARAGVER